MLIIVAMENYSDYWNLKDDLYDRLSIVKPRLFQDLLEVDVDAFNSIRIVFKPALPMYIKGIRPDYYWTNSYEVDKYFRQCPNVKCLSNFTELTNLVLTECMKEKGDLR